MDRISVSVRIRPLNKREMEAGNTEAWVHEGQNRIAPKHGVGPSFSFDRVFSKGEHNEDVYGTVAKRIVGSTMDGFNGTIFAYGQTSTGKTFTMSGTADHPGIIPRSVDDVFARIAATPDREYLLRVSFMEIYNERITDLLSTSSDALKVHEDVHRGVFVTAREEVVTSPEEVMALIQNGEKNRHIGATNMNEYSSRSHTIFRLTVESRERGDDADDDSGAGAKRKASASASSASASSASARSGKRSSLGGGAVMVSTLHLVDLAGSEKVSQTGAEGLRLKEAGSINRSLLTLGTVIHQLSKGQRGHIPYRNSKLTRILQPALGGNARTAIVATITPAAEFTEETLSTLKFATRAKEVKNHAEVNEVVDDQTMLRRYRKQIADLERQLSGQGVSAEIQEELARSEREKTELQGRIGRLTNLILVSGGGGKVIGSPPPKGLAGFGARDASRRATICSGKQLAPLLSPGAAAGADVSAAGASSSHGRRSSAGGRPGGVISAAGDVAGGGLTPPRKSFLSSSEHTEYTSFLRGPGLPIALMSSTSSSPSSSSPSPSSSGSGSGSSSLAPTGIPRLGGAAAAEPGAPLSSSAAAPSASSEDAAAAAVASSSSSSSSRMRRAVPASRHPDAAIVGVLRAQIDDLRSKFKAADARATAAETERDEVAGALMETRGSLETVEAERDELASRVGSLEASLEEAVGGLESANTDLGAARGELETVRADLARATEDAAASRTDAEDYQVEMEALRKVLAEAHEEAGSLREQLTAAEETAVAARADAKASKKSAAEAIDKANKKSGSSSKEQAAHLKEVERLKSKLSATEEKLKQAVKEKGTLKTDLGAMQGELKSSQRTLKLVQKEKDRLERAREAAKEAARGEAEQIVERSKGRFDEELAAVQKEVEAQAARADAAEADLEAARADLDAARSKVSDECAALKEALDAAVARDSEECASLRELLASAREALETEEETTRELADQIAQLTELAECEARNVAEAREETRSAQAAQAETSEGLIDVRFELEMATSARDDAERRCEELAAERDAGASLAEDNGRDLARAIDALAGARAAEDALRGRLAAAELELDAARAVIPAAPDVAKLRTEVVALRRTARRSAEERAQVVARCHAAEADRDAARAELRAALEDSRAAQGSSSPDSSSPDSSAERKVEELTLKLRALEYRMVKEGRADEFALQRDKASLQYELNYSNQKRKAAVTAAEALRTEVAALRAEREEVSAALRTQESIAAAESCRQRRGALELAVLERRLDAKLYGASHAELFGADDADTSDAVRPDVPVTPDDAENVASASGRRVSRVRSKASHTRHALGTLAGRNGVAPECQTS